MSTPNFLLDVLTKSDSSTLDEHRDALKIVSEKISRLKNELILSLESSFGAFDSDISKVTCWFMEVCVLDEETGKLTGVLNEQKYEHGITSEEYEFVKQEIVSCSNNIHLLKELVTVVQGLESAEPSDLFVAARRLRQAKDTLDTILQEYELERSESILGLQSSIITRIVETDEFAVDAWESKFRFQQNTLVVDPECGKGDVVSLIDALKNLNQYSRTCQKFSLLFWDELLSKACTPHYCSKIAYPNSKQNLKKPMLQAQQDCVPTRDTDTDVTSPDGASPFIHENYTAFGSASTVLFHVKKLDTASVEIGFVFKNICRLLIHLSEIFGEKVEVMRDLAEAMGPKMVHELSSKSLKSLILQGSDGSKEKAKENIMHLHEFRKKLREINFRIPEAHEHVFDEFESNFDSLFMRQVRQDALATVRTLILKDLHHTVETVSDGEASRYVDSDARDELQLQKSPFLQQEYTISRSIADMTDLLVQHLNNYPNDLMLVSNAYDMFMGIVNIPKPEADVKDFIPLSAVLIHNNCMFLTYHAEVTFPMCEDKIPLLRTKGTQAFTYMMKSVRSHLNIMTARAMAGLDEDSDNLKNKREHQFLQIAAEFGKLNRVFSEVLPRRVWREALATIVDHTIGEICSKILACEDISAKTANDLADSSTKLAVETCSIFQKEGMSIREAEGYSAKLIPKWQRFRLLTFVLTASMREIQDKWVNGCGPLSLDFTAEEIRKLVRALFQNTDHRAAFLTSIK